MTARCEACGAILPPGVMLCASCGAMARERTAPRDGGLPTLPGERTSPALVVFLTVITVGLFAFVFWWNTSKLVDDARGRSFATTPTRIGIVAALVAIPSILLPLLAPRDPAVFVVALVSFPTAIVFLTLGKYRLWSLLEAMEARANVPARTSPSTLLTLTLFGLVIPFVALAPLAITQARLNDLRPRAIPRAP